MDGAAGFGAMICDSSCNVVAFSYDKLEGSLIAYQVKLMAFRKGLSLVVSWELPIDVVESDALNEVNEVNTRSFGFFFGCYYR